MKIYKIIFLSVFLILVNEVNAQKDQLKNRLGEKIDSVMHVKLIEKAGLDSITADRFIEAYRVNNKKVKVIIKEKKALMQSIENDPGAYDIESKINKLFELDSEVIEVKKSFITDLKVFLTPEQIAKTIVMRNNFGKIIRKELNKHRKNNQSRDKSPD